MKVSRKWLSSYLNIDNLSDKQLYDVFTANVCEVEIMYKLSSATNLTVGEVLTCEDIEGTHLHKCNVQLSTGVSQIVCGAPNCKAGIKVIVALPGAELPGGFKIKASKIRGIESNGMLCSLQEIGIDEKFVPEEFKNGIYIFDSSVEVGQDPLKLLGFDDTIYDLNVTANRSDLLSIEGVCFDLAAALGQEYKVEEFKKDFSNFKNPMNIKIDTDKCYKYAMRYIKNVSIGESPKWLKERLVASGVRPINNVVDITNYVLMYLGQPLHSFDADKLGNNVLVRMAKNGEKLTTLDEKERDLLESDIVITNGNDAVCLGGVMGGLSTEVTNETKNIALEAAYFEPLSIRKTSTRLDLKSESSYRFEHKICYERVERALDYASFMIKELAGGEVSNELKEDIKVEMPKQNVLISTNDINNVLGTSFNDDDIKSFFNRYQFEYKFNNGNFDIELPSRRMDLNPSKQDIIEDVARLYGYDNIPTTIAKTRDKGGLTLRQRRIRLIRQILSSLGLNETVSYSLVSEAKLPLFVKEVNNPVKVMMSLTKDREYMRQSLLNGVVDAISYNLARGNDSLAFFEIGNVYSMDNEKLHLALALNGVFNSQRWAQDNKKADFFTLKGIIDYLFYRLGYQVSYLPYDEMTNLHPGRTAKIMHKNEMIGFIGELHPKFEKENDLKDTYVLEIDLTSLVNDEYMTKYHPVSKFPSINRDLAMLINKDILIEDVLKTVKKSASYISNVELFDLYEGEKISKDKKSVAFSILFEAPDRTLTTEEVDNEIKKILASLKNKFDADIRE